MSHPWITQHGLLPLVSLHQLAAPPPCIEVTRSDCNTAIDRASIVSLMRARLKEKVVRAGECLYM